MPHNPSWNKPAPDVLSFESLIAWLEKQNPRKGYNYDDCKGGCLYGQYMASHGIRWDESGAMEGNQSPRGAFCSMVYATVASAGPRTFGAALKRARAALTTEAGQ